MNQVPATATLRRAVRAVILADEDHVLLCASASRTQPYRQTHADGYDGVVNDYFLVRTTRFEPRGVLSEDDLAAEHISGMRWWRHEEIAAYAGPDLFSPATSPHRWRR